MKINCPQCHRVLCRDSNLNFTRVNHDNCNWWHCVCGWGVREGQYNSCAQGPDGERSMHAYKYKYRFGLTIRERVLTRFKIKLDEWAYQRTQRPYFPMIVVKRRLVFRDEKRARLIMLQNLKRTITCNPQRENKVQATQLRPEAADKVT